MSDTFDIDIYGDEEPRGDPVRKPEDGKRDEGSRRGPREEQKDASGVVPRMSAPEPMEYQLDPNATSALHIGELNWWTTEESVRGWAAVAGMEAQVKEVTFSEHKVNGKSKGAVYMEFQSPHAAAATRAQIAREAGSSRFLVNYTAPQQNPFKTLPKDPPPRAGRGAPPPTAPRGSGAPRGGGMMNGGGGRGMGGGMNFNPMMFNPMMGRGRGGANQTPQGPGRGQVFNPMMFPGGFPQGFSAPHFNPQFFPNQGSQAGQTNPNAASDGNPHGQKRTRGA